MNEPPEIVDIPSNPWQMRREIGLVNALVQTVKLVLFKPAEFFDNLVVPHSINDPFLFYIAVSIPVIMINSLVGLLIPAGGQEVSPVYSFIGMIIILPIAIFIGAGFMHLFVMMLRGKGGFIGTLSIFAYASSTGVFSIIPILGPIVGSVWNIVITVMAYKRVHQFSTARAICAYSFLLIIPCVALLAAIAIPNFLRAKISANDAYAESNLKMIASAAETYAKANAEIYPRSVYDLTNANPPYMSEGICGETVAGYAYHCQFDADGYIATATPTTIGTTGTTTLTIETGGIITPSKEDRFLAPSAPEEY